MSLRRRIRKQPEEKQEDSSQYYQRDCSSSDPQIIQNNESRTPRNTLNAQIDQEVQEKKSADMLELGKEKATQVVLLSPKTQCLLWQREKEDEAEPCPLMRMKEDVESTFPKLCQTIIDVEMSSKQKIYYRDILERNRTSILCVGTVANCSSISIELRKCCSHPCLIFRKIEVQILGGAQNKARDTEAFIKASGKVMLLMKLLAKFKNEGKKVLLFFQFADMLDLLEHYLRISGYNCEIHKGRRFYSWPRQQATQSNKEKSHIDVFLIYTKAEGLAINLAPATPIQIVIFDSDWNLQSDIQAISRAHRVDQKKQLTVYRLITANSLESEMFQMSSRKLGLDKAMFADGTCRFPSQLDEWQKQLTKNEIRVLLAKGIIGFLEGEAKSQQFFSRSIEDILSSNARKAQYASTQNSCAFSEREFKVEINNNDIQISAPSFWQMLLMDVESPIDQLLRNQLTDDMTLQAQQSLMLQIYQIVDKFIRKRSLRTGLHEEDKARLEGLLYEISSMIWIDEDFRYIAYNLKDEIVHAKYPHQLDQIDKIKEYDILSVKNIIKERVDRRNQSDQ